MAEAILNAPEIDPARQKRARAYARVQRRLWVLEMGTGALYLILWIALGWGPRLRQALSAIESGGVLPMSLPWWVSLLLFALVLSLPWLVLSLPLDFYTGFVLPHRYDLSTQTLRGWISDLIKGGLISSAIGVPLLVGLYFILRSAPKTWWLLAAGGYMLFTVVLAILAPVLLMPIFYKLKPLEEEYSDLSHRLAAMAEAAGARVEGVFTFDMSRRTRAANAALTGLGRTRRILLGDTLLSQFTSDEIETVLAHELAHHVHKDVPISLLGQGLLVTASFYLADAIFRLASSRTSIPGIEDPAGLPLLLLLLGLIALLTMPLSNAFSRWRESLADEFALKAIGKPEAFSSAMTRLANQNLAEVDPEPWVVVLFHSHPPLRSRIEKAQEFAANPPMSS